MNINGSPSQRGGISFWPRRPLSISRRPTSAFLPRIMPSNLNAPSLSAVMLAALLLCARGASIGHAPTDSPVDDSSGEAAEEEPTEEPRVFKLAIDSAQQCQKNFADEFHIVQPFAELDNYKLSQLPTRCLSSFSKEACLKTVVEGLQTYIVLLRFVESQYPNNSTISGTKCLTVILKEQLVRMMKNPQRVTALSSSQEEQLLNGTKSYQDTFSRKMAAHSIMKKLCEYLIDNEKLIINRNKARLAKRTQHYPTSITTC